MSLFVEQTEEVNAYCTRYWTYNTQQRQVELYGKSGYRFKPIVKRFAETFKLSKLECSELLSQRDKLRESYTVPQLKQRFRNLKRGFISFYKQLEATLAADLTPEQKTPILHKCAIESQHKLVKIYACWAAFPDEVRKDICMDNEFFFKRDDWYKHYLMYDQKVAKRAQAANRISEDAIKEAKQWFEEATGYDASSSIGIKYGCFFECHIACQCLFLGEAEGWYHLANRMKDEPPFDGNYKLSDAQLDTESYKNFKDMYKDRSKGADYEE